MSFSWANSGWNQYLGGAIWVLAELIAQLKPYLGGAICVLAELIAQLKPYLGGAIWVLAELIAAETNI